MCACEPGFVCRQCAGTPFDPYYMEDDPPRLTESKKGRSCVERWCRTCRDARQGKARS